MSSQPPAGTTNLRDAIIVAVITGLFVIIGAFIQRGGGTDPTTVPPASVTLISTDIPTQTLRPTITPLPTPQLIENFKVDVTTYKGTVYNVPKTGWYLFEYDKGAYSAWDNGGLSTCKPECFSGSLIGFVDQQPTFNREGNLNDIGALFTWYTEGSPNSLRNLNPHLWGSIAEVEKEFSGHRTGAFLRQGEQVYFIAGDCRGCFTDNSGGIYINVSYRP